MTNILSFEKLRNEIIGRDFFFETPYGKRLLTYADYTASGRSLTFIEKYLIQIQRQYANTHTEDDVTGRHMTGLLHKAERIIKQAFNAENNCYVIATGTGATGAILKAQEILGVRFPASTKFLVNQIISKIVGKDEEKKSFIDFTKKKLEHMKPVVFIGPYEHHSNDIIWRESFAEVVDINLTPEGYFDLEDLEKKVSEPVYQDRVKIGSFSAASNVTGVISPVYEIARIMHKYDGLACFDFAASAPYVEINMNKDEESYFDAVFISPHKFIGGPGSAGILVFNKEAYNSTISPTLAAGGTVDFVSSYAVDYIPDVETREKAGTPGILQTIKAALAIDLKDSIGIEKIEAKEKEYTQRAFKKLSKIPNIEILGPQDPNSRIPIFSFLIKHGDKYLHPKFCTKLLNDLFGIQSRAGCSCAGVYGHRLLNIGEQKSRKFRKVLQKGFMGIKPGWVRVNFHYSFSEEEFDFICNAIEFISMKGHLFLPNYIFNFANGEWNHREFEDKDLDFNPSVKNILKVDLNNCFNEDIIDRKVEFQKYLTEANILVEKLSTTFKIKKLPDPDAEEIRWFNFTNIVE